MDNISNTLSVESWSDEYPLDYRIIATIVHILIFIFGLLGNLVVIVVVAGNKHLQSPAFIYLVSLALADLIVLVSAVPEAILAHQIGNRWIFGQIGCSVFIFANFLGINAASLKNPKVVVIGLWVFSIVYCSPWFGLTEVRPDYNSPAGERLYCELRLSPQLYSGLFSADCLLFYVVPLLVAIVCYTQIAMLLLTHREAGSWKSQTRGSFKENLQMDSQSSAILSVATWDTTSEVVFREGEVRNLRSKSAVPRNQVLHMLVVIVVLFALAWLPFRGLLIYNSCAAEPWLDIWFLFFAKTLIYLNSAINPFLYDAMSPRFRLAVRRLFILRKGNSADGRLIFQDWQGPQKTSLLSGESLDVAL